MSEPNTPPPPKSKPGSLRDRIAAFETKPSASATAPPPPRPKPSGVQWKPKPPASPPASPSASDKADVSARKPVPVAPGMSAADAKESIGRGGSLRERMAALQGRGGFGPPPPPTAPKPAVEKPKWKPPPPVISPPIDEEDNHPESGDAVEPSKPKEESEEQRAGEKPEEETEDAAELDPEEEERQRRAAIAARMARLGGARVGMAPPVFGKKPEAKRVSKPKLEDDLADKPPLQVELVTEATNYPPATTSNVEDSDPGLVASDVITEQIPDPKSSQAPLPQSESASVKSAAHIPPISMPVPAVPRRTGPPRKKAANAKSTSPAASVALDEIDDTHNESLAGAGLDTAEANAVGRDSESSAESYPSAVEVEPDSDRQVNEEEEAITVGKDEDVQPPEEVAPVASTTESDNPHEDNHDDDRSEPVEEPAEPSPLSGSAAELVPATEDTVEETEEEEAARRKRIADRLAKSGGLNPFAAPPYVPQTTRPAVTSPTSSTSEQSPTELRMSARKSTIDSASQVPTDDATAASPPPSAGVEQRVSRRDSADSSRSTGPINAPVRKTSLSAQAEVVQDVHPMDDQVLAEEEEVSDLEPERATCETDDDNDEIEQKLDSESDYGHESDDELETASRDTGSLHMRGKHEPESKGCEESDAPSQMSGHYLDSVDNDEAHDREYYSEGGQPIDGPVNHAVTGSESEGDTDSRPPAGATEELADDGKVDALPPPIKRTLPPMPAPRRSTDDSSASQSPQQAPPVVAASRRSIPPPPRSAPVPPRDQSAAEDSAAYARPARRSLPPPPPPASTRPQQVAQEVGQFMTEPAGMNAQYTVAQRPQTPPRTESYSKPNSPSHSRISSSPGGPRAQEQRPSSPRPRAPTPDTRVNEMDKKFPPMSVFPRPPPRRATSPSMSPPLRPTFPTPLSREVRPPPPLAPRPAPQRKPTREVVAPAPVRPEITPLHLEDPEQQLSDDEDGDPIDPGFHSPQSRSPSSSSPHQRPVPPPRSERLPSPPATADAPIIEEDAEQARRQTIAERMAKLGGIKFGAPLVVQAPQGAPAPAERDEQETSPSQNAPAAAQEEDTPAPDDEEEEERARKARIASKLAGMGGMRFGMLPSMGAPPSHAQVKSESSDAGSQPPPRRASVAAPPPPPPPAPESEHGSENVSATDSDLVDVQADESEMEEVDYEDLEDDSAPPLPIRSERPNRANAPPPQASPPPPPLPPGRKINIPGGRPPIPATPMFPPVRRTSGSTVTSERRASRDTSPSVSRPPLHPFQHSEFVMVDEPAAFDAEAEGITPPPPPPPRVNRAIPPPPVRSPPPTGKKASSHAIDSQWELPDVSQTPLAHSQITDMSSSGWSEDSTTYPAAPSSPPLPPVPAAKPRVTSSSRQPPAVAEVQLSADDLLTLWGQVGVHVGETAAMLHEKSKKALIGDGTFPGFVHAVLSQTPHASLAVPAQSGQTYGHLIYSQSGSTVQKRTSDIMPGDVISLLDAKLKGHKGLHSYQQSVGTDGEAVVGVVSEFEPKKSKVKVYQANQHVGGQTVELVSYRLEDLKSGAIKVFRVAKA